MLLAVGVQIAPVTAQNTIDGLKKEVPQEELLRQSAFLEAEKARMLGETDEAIQLYRNFLYKNEQADAAWYGLARCYVEKKGYGTALETIEEAIQINPDNEWYLLLKAGIFEKNGQHAFAASVYEQLISRFPAVPAFYEQYAYLLVLAESPKQALKVLDKLESLVGITEKTATRKHLIYVAMGDNKKAAGELQRLVDSYPYELEYRKSLAKYYAELGETGKAKTTWESVLKIAPQDPDAKMALMEKSLNKREENRFLVDLLPLFRDPTVPIDTKIAAIAPQLEQLGPEASVDMVKAMLDLGKALEDVHKSDPKAWSISADMYYLLGQHEMALTRYLTCIELKPAVFAVYDNALRLLHDKKAYEALLTLAEKAMDLFPNQAGAYYWFGTATNCLNRPQEALSSLENALLMAGKNKLLWLDLMDQIAVAYLLMKDPESAVKRLDQALAKGGEQHAGILEHYGDALAQLGEMDQAVVWWRKAQKIKHSPELDKKLPKI